MDLFKKQRSRPWQSLTLALTLALNAGTRAADPDLKSKTGLTPLIVAAGRGHTEIVGLLLAGKASPALAGRAGVIPLVAAARGGHVATVERLLKTLSGNPRPVEENQGVMDALSAAHEKGHSNVAAALSRVKILHQTLTPTPIHP